MADVQSNPYGNLKIKPSAHGPTLFSADPNVSISRSQAGSEDSSLQSLVAADSPYISGRGTFRARVAGSLSTSRARPLARDRGQSSRSSSLNNSLNNSSGMMRTAKASPMPSLSMSQPRGVIEYSNDTFSEMLNRSLQHDKQSSELENTRSPATNKENDHMQASHSKEERSGGHSVLPGGASRDVTWDSAQGDGLGNDLEGHVPPIVFPNGFETPGARAHSGQHSVGSEPGAAPGGAMSEPGGKGDVKWTWQYDKDDTFTFTADREPDGLEIPKNFTVHKTFDGGQVRT
jgi:hypothetical protein